MWRRLAGVVLVAAMSTGCASHSQRAGSGLQRFEQGDVDGAVEIFERHGGERNRYLHQLEIGRMRQLDGDFAASKTAFDRVIEHLIIREEGAVIRLRDVGGTTLAATVTDDRMRPFVLARFEVVMLFVAQAINHLMLGEPESAWVQVRRAVRVQEMWLEEAAALDVERGGEDQQDEFFDKSMERLQQRSPMFFDTAARAVNTQENPFAWYLAGVMFEQQQDVNGAYRAYRRAAEMMPANNTMRRDHWRLGLRFDHPKYARLIASHGYSLDEFAGSGAEVVIVVDEGLISRRRVERVPVFLGSWHTLTVPYYSDPPYRPTALQVEWDGGVSARLQPAVYVQSLAYRDLQEKLGAIMLRNITRAVARQALYQASQASDNTVVKLLGMIFNIAALLADSADTRSWYTLPMAIQLARVRVDPGIQTIRLRNLENNWEVSMDLELARGQVQLLWMADTGTRSLISVAGIDREIPVQVEANMSLVGERNFAFGRVVPFIPPSDLDRVSLAEETSIPGVSIEKDDGSGMDKRQNHGRSVDAHDRATGE